MPGNSIKHNNSVSHAPILHQCLLEKKIGVWDRERGIYEWRNGAFWWKQGAKGIWPSSSRAETVSRWNGGSLNSRRKLVGYGVQRLCMSREWDSPLGTLNPRCLVGTDPTRTAK